MSKKPAKRRNALGRGLGALLDDSPSASTPNETINPPSAGTISEISIDEIETNPFQPRSHFDEQALNVGATYYHAVAMTAGQRLVEEGSLS